MSRKEEIKKKAIEIAMPCFNGKCKDFIDDPCMGTPCYANERYEAAISMAEWADQNPREGLWDAEKVCKVFKDYMLKERFFDNRLERTAIIDNVVHDLRKAMEEQQ